MHNTSRKVDRMKTIILYSLLFTFALPAFASGDSTAIHLREHIGYLASDALEGRRSGSRGAELAAAYVAKQFSSCGLLPVGDGGTYFQSFVFTAGVQLGTNNTLVSGEGKEKRTWRINEDFRPLAFSANGSAERAARLRGIRNQLDRPGVRRLCECRCQRQSRPHHAIFSCR